jgi:hypothetical protein
MQIKSYYKLILLFLAVLILLVGFILYKGYLKEDNLFNALLEPAPIEYGYGYQEPYMASEQEDWLTHESEKWSFSIQYPKYLKVYESGSPATGRLFYDIENVGERTADLILEEDEVLEGTIELGQATISGQWSDSGKDYIIVNLISVLPKKFGLSDEESERFINTYVQQRRYQASRRSEIILDEDLSLGDYKFRKLLTAHNSGRPEYPRASYQVLYFYKDLPGRLYVFSLSTENPEELEMLKSIIATFKIK